MLQVDVGHFMSHHACELGLIVRLNNRTNIDEHGATREGERINFLLRDYMKLERPRIFLWDHVGQLFS